MSALRVHFCERQLKKKRHQPGVCVIKSGVKRATNIYCLLPTWPCGRWNELVTSLHRPPGGPASQSTAAGMQCLAHYRLNLLEK